MWMIVKKKCYLCTILMINNRKSSDVETRKFRIQTVIQTRYYNTNLTVDREPANFKRKIPTKSNYQKSKSSIYYRTYERDQCVGD